MTCYFQDASNDDPLAKTDAIVVAMGLDEDVVYSKSTSLQVTRKVARLCFYTVWYSKPRTDT